MEPENRVPGDVPGRLVTFPDLAWAHFNHERRRLEQTGHVDAAAEEYPKVHDRAAASYPSVKRDFEKRYGEIVAEYWSRKQPSGVAVTRKRSHRLHRPFREEGFMFHRATDWVTVDLPKIGEKLFQCEVLAIKASQVLRGPTENTALSQIFATASYLLAFADREEPKETDKAAEVKDAEEAVLNAAEGAAVVKDKEETAVLKAAERELRKVGVYYLDAGQRIGRMVYTWGMVIGLAILGGLIAVFAIPLWIAGPLSWESKEVQEFLISFGAGAVGAVVSVLQRMTTDKFTVHFDDGRKVLYMLGSFRPMLGAVFGVVTYLALAGGLLDITRPSGSTTAYYAVFSFLAGFSERFTKVVIRDLEGRPNSAGSDRGGETRFLDIDLSPELRQRERGAAFVPKPDDDADAALRPLVDGAREALDALAGALEQAQGRGSCRKEDRA